MRDFRKLDIWVLSMTLSDNIFKILRDFPQEEKFVLVSQMSRCCISIPSNIAEGCSRNSEKDFHRFLQVALGSAFELETQIEISHRRNYIETKDYEEIIIEIQTVQKKINKFCSVIKSRI